MIQTQTTRNGTGRLATIALAPLVALLGQAAPVQGQCEVAGLTADSDGYTYYFAPAIALDDDVLVAGHPWDDLDEVFSFRGSVYVFTNESGTWTKDVRLTASDAWDDDEFGTAVAIDGDTIVVGSPFEDEDAYGAGAVYIFDRAGGVWSQSTKLMAGASAMLIRYGAAVAISGDMLAVGAPDWSFSGAGNYSGKVYLYRRNGGSWSFEQAIEASDVQGFATFGESLDFSGASRLIVGASGDGTNEDSYKGAAYVFDYDALTETWEETSKLTASNGKGFDYFGGSVAIDGASAIVGAWGAGGETGDYNGAVYMFALDGVSWSETSSFSGAGTHDRLGWSVAIDGDKALAGSPKDPFSDGPDSPAGELRVYDLSGSTWSGGSTISATGTLADSFGVAVALDGDQIAAGATGLAWLDEGTAYVFAEDGVDCNDNGICDATDIAIGTSSDLDGNSIPDECDEPGTPADINGDDSVDVSDLLLLFLAWGACDGCPEDINGDGMVDVGDLLDLILAWG